MTINTDVSAADNEVEEPTDQYVITVNGEEVWRSEGHAMLVDRVVIRNARGEVTVIGSANQDKYLEIDINERSYDAPETYLDMTEKRLADERRERFEPDTSGRTSDEEYVEADPETGLPVGQEPEEEEEEEEEEVENTNPTEQPAEKSDLDF